MIAMIPHSVRSSLLDITHLTCHILDQLVALVIHLYYLLLISFEQNKNAFIYLPVDDLKLPKHIALSFTNEMDQLDMESIARILCWCKQLDVKNITLYDDLGKLKDRRKELIKYTEYKLGYSFTDYADRLNIISRLDGRQKFIEEVKELVKLEKVDLNVVNKRVGWSTDPELLINFGSPVCLHGFPPWQLRLTEILSIPTHKNLSQHIFIQCLRRFSKISQREGI